MKILALLRGEMSWMTIVTISSLVSQQYLKESSSLRRVSGTLNSKMDDSCWDHLVFFSLGWGFSSFFPHVAISQNDLSPEIRAVLEPPQIWKTWFLSLIYGLNEKRSRFLLNPLSSTIRHSRGTLGPSKSTKTQSFHGCVFKLGNLWWTCTSTS